MTKRQAILSTMRPKPKGGKIIPWSKVPNIKPRGYDPTQPGGGLTPSLPDGPLAETTQAQRKRYANKARNRPSFTEDPNWPRGKGRQFRWGQGARGQKRKSRLV